MSELLIIIASGLTIGALGSLHCVGMCGPLALAMPTQRLVGWQRVWAALLYNLGRALSYALIGLGLGLVGQTFTLFRIEQWLSLGMGVLVLAMLLGYHFVAPKVPLLEAFTQWVRDRLSRYLLAEKSMLSYLSIGMLNGFLPCGLVYVATAAALATGIVWKSGLLMFSFGLGTLPAMFAAMYFSRFISFDARRRLNRATPYFVGLIAVLLIIRGLNLGIPYLSPHFGTKEKTEVICH